MSYAIPSDSLNPDPAVSIDITTVKTVYQTVRAGGDPAVKCIGQVRVTGLDATAGVTQTLTLTLQRDGVTIRLPLYIAVDDGASATGYEPFEIDLFPGATYTFTLVSDAPGDTTAAAQVELHALVDGLTAAQGAQLTNASDQADATHAIVSHATSGNAALRTQLDLKATVAAVAALNNLSAADVTGAVPTTGQIAAAVDVALVQAGDGTDLIQAVADAIAADWVAGDASPLAFVAAMLANSTIATALGRLDATVSSRASTEVANSIEGRVDGVLTDTAALTAALAVTDGKADQVVARLPSAGRTIAAAGDTATTLDDVGGGGGSGLTAAQAQQLADVLADTDAIQTALPAGGAKIAAAGEGLTAAQATLLATINTNVQGLTVEGGAVLSDVEDAPVPASRTARLVRSGAVLLAEEPLYLSTDENGASAPLFAASFASDLAAGGRVAIVTGVTVVKESAEGGLAVVGAAKRDKHQARFVLGATLAGSYLLQVAVTYSDGTPAVGYVPVVAQEAPALLAA